MCIQIIIIIIIFYYYFIYFFFFFGGGGGGGGAEGGLRQLVINTLNIFQKRDSQSRLARVLV